MNLKSDYHDKRNQLMRHRRSAKMTFRWSEGIINDSVTVTNRFL